MGIAACFDAASKASDAKLNRSKRRPAAVLTLTEIRDLTAEMLEAERKYLPQFAGKQLRAAPAIHVPADVVRQEVPLDPALAIANRFGKLAKA